MRALALFIFSITCLCSLAQQLPSFAEVDSVFRARYSTAGLPDGEYIRYQKRKDGWYASIVNADNEELSRQRFYYAGNNNYTELQLSHLNPGTSGEGEKILDADAAQWFDLMPCYGYPGWEKDAAGQLESRFNQLTVTEMYALGRTYSSYASSLIHSNQPYSDPRTAAPYRRRANNLSAEQLVQYRNANKKAVRMFEMVQQKSPDFVTIVGPIGTKLANEHMTAFLDLRTYQNEAEARKHLVPGIYPDYMLSFAGNILMSCDSNAILFTFGDSDTYPLLYLQYLHNVRPDILVVNTSLLNDLAYANSLRSPCLKAAPLPLSIPEFFNRKRFAYAVMDQSSEDRITVADALAFLGDSTHRNEKGYYELPASGFSMMGNGPMSWDIDEGYILMSEWFFLDILENHKNRPIYFTTTSGTYFHMEDYLLLEGLTQRLYPEELPAAQKDFKVNEQVTMDFLRTKMDSTGFWQATEPESEKILATHAYPMGLLTQQLLSNGEKDRAAEVIRMYFSIFKQPGQQLALISQAMIRMFATAGYTAEARKEAENLRRHMKLHPGVDYGNVPMQVDEFLLNSKD